MVKSKNGALLDDMVHNVRKLFDKYKDNNAGVVLDEGLTKLLFDLDLTISSGEAERFARTHIDQNENNRFVKGFTHKKH